MADKDYLDVRLAQVYRELRIAAGLTAPALADLLNITQPQLSRMESAENKIPATRLYRTAKYVGVPISMYFDQLDEEFQGKDEIPTIVSSNLKLVRQLSMEKQQGLSAILKELVKT